jgi:hypothetical protein
MQSTVRARDAGGRRLAQKAALNAEHGFNPLGDVAQHLASVDIACNFCERRGKVSIARLMREHGQEKPIPTILRMLSADCPRRLAGRIAEPCGAHLPELSDVFAPRKSVSL